MADAYIGAETGALKGVDFSKNIFQNYNTVNTLDKTQEISRICRVDRSTVVRNQNDDDDDNDNNNNNNQGGSIAAADESILCALVNRQLKLFDPSTGEYTTLFNCEDGRGAIRGLEQLERGKIVTCVESGDVSVWNLDGFSKEATINAGENVCRMRTSPSKSNILATGGRENALKIWDLHNPRQPIFAAKNVRNDWLNLRVPIWETDFRLSPTNEAIVTCTGHQHIRMYDPRSGQRRPVYQIQWGDCPFTSVSLTPRENQVVAGNTKGYMGLFDFRGQGESKLVHIYRGIAGSISSIECHPTQPYVASCGIDRFTRLHHLLTKEQLNKIYCKVRLNCLLLNDDLSTTSRNYDRGEQESDDAYHSDEREQQSDDDDDNSDAEERVWTDMRKVKELEDESDRENTDESDDDEDVEKTPPKKKRRKSSAKIAAAAAAILPPRKRAAETSSGSDNNSGEAGEREDREERKKTKTYNSRPLLSNLSPRKRPRSPPQLLPRSASSSPSKGSGKTKKKRKTTNEKEKEDSSSKPQQQNKRKRKSVATVVSNEDVVKMSKMDVAS